MYIEYFITVGKKKENDTAYDKRQIRTNYFKPIWRWLKDAQNDFAARADWCVKNYTFASHHPVVLLKNTLLDIKTKASAKIKLNASASTDPDGDVLFFMWWQYTEAGTYNRGELTESKMAKITITIPKDALPGVTIHMICEVSDSRTPSLTRYQRVIITIK